MKVCYFGLHEPKYPRNAIIKKALKSIGIEVVDCAVSPKTNSVVRNISLFAKFLKLYRSGISIILVGEFSHGTMPLAYALSRLFGLPLVFDPFISLYDSSVFDRKEIYGGSMTAKIIYLVDKTSMKLADCLLADTNQHREYYINEFGVKNNIYVVPIGANEEVFHPTDSHVDADDMFNVVFWGTFIPLQGLEYILQAAKELESEKNISITLIGNGQESVAMKSLSEKLKLNNVTFNSLVPSAKVPVYAAAADICLGIFGKTQKAKRVIPNKVYEAIAMKKPVITGDSPAIREYFEHGKNAYLVPMANPEELARGILALKENPDMRAVIAEGGYRLFKNTFSKKSIGEILKTVFEKVLKDGR